jgi:uncharacterized protein
VNIDDPQILENMFFPRRAFQGRNLPPGAVDGTLKVDADVSLGYRLYVHTPDAPLVLFFHGNGEVAPDYDFGARMYHMVGLSLMVVDYRGYGWSTGTPLFSTFLPDALAVADALPEVMAAAKINADVSLFIMGRSLGSAPAVHIAYKRRDRFRALLIDSGYADTPSLFKGRGLTLPDEMLTNPDLPFNNENKVREMDDMPLFVVHGQEDQLLPVKHGQALYDASRAEHKSLYTVAGAGHNDLMLVAGPAYMTRMKGFLTSLLG